MKAQILAGIAAAALLCGVGPALADDPPARVGRLADISGAVSLRLDPAQPWAVAARNQPVTSGMSLWTEPQARAALEIGPTELHLGDQAELDIRQLDDSAFAAQLGQGSVNIDIADLQAGESWTVDTPRGTITLDRPGEYRIDAGTTQDPTQVVVFSGEAQIAGGPDGPVDIQGGETGVVAGGSDPFSYTLAQSADRSPLDDWADGRIRAADTAPRYVSRAMTGWQDLAAAGTWRETPGTGAIWYPTDVPSGWVPYRYGRWSYDSRWGWTWIDDQPWGFAPFHYGRWAYVDDRWGWVPGPVEMHPVYAPALVSFFAGAAVGAAVTLAADSHPIGWYPLGPGEIYRPPYRVSDTYVRNVNVTNIRNVQINRITNIHNGPTTIVEDGANRRFATVVPAQVLAGRQPVAHAALPVAADQLDHARLTPVAALPHPEGPAAGQTPAPHPALSRGPEAPGPGGHLPLAAADPTRPRPPAPSQPARPIDRAAGPAAPAQATGPSPVAPTGTPPAAGTAQAQPAHPPLPAPSQRGPEPPSAAARPGPASQEQHPPLPERSQRPPPPPARRPRHRPTSGSSRTRPDRADPHRRL
ncbi:DUF6600 domain-containing protein [Inquilinus sp. Marseille-Q2685]|uniref:DUF6600 domain-containing protein n=1 Tax=Inquilinus sp. Marseille-Q2685 TaxID=2866581 RepID=UPI001CE4A903|nr:DUF6600 domain-containing protein [Inquilinus sp. Marseille-Q2685]